MSANGCSKFIADKPSKQSLQHLAQGAFFWGLSDVDLYLQCINAVSVSRRDDTTAPSTDELQRSSNTEIATPVIGFCHRCRAMKGASTVLPCVHAAS